MSSGVKYNLKSPGVKRLMREAAELREPTDEYFARPLDDNLFEWHFTVQGPSGTEFQNGLYHGRILLPTQYPMQPPNIILLTPNGRFEVNKKICLSISGYHPESWQPSWSIRTALLALIAFMPSPGRGTIGSLDYTPEEREILAKKSQTWECEICGKLCDQLRKPGEVSGSKPLTKEETELIQQIALKAEDDNRKPTDDENVPRQRVVVGNVAEEVERVEEIRTENPRDKALTYVMFLLITAIFGLILRRLFWV